MLFAWSFIFHAVQFGPSDSGPAFSGNDVWSFIFKPCICRRFITLGLTFSIHAFSEQLSNCSCTVKIRQDVPYCIDMWITVVLCVVLLMLILT